MLPAPFFRQVLASFRSLIPTENRDASISLNAMKTSAAGVRTAFVRVGKLGELVFMSALQSESTGLAFDISEYCDDLGEQFEEEIRSLGVNPSEPTGAKPGSEEKVTMLAARYAAGLPLWHNDDCYDHGPGSIGSLLLGGLGAAAGAQPVASKG